MTDFHYQPLFELGADDTPYRQLRVDGVTTVSVDGRELLKVDPDVLRQVAHAAFDDISHLLRSSHLAQLRSIFDDPEASHNDKFVALELLRNANIAAGRVLPGCQDTGTAIVMRTHFDNTENNPLSVDPDQWVTFGRRSASEMSHMWVGVTYFDNEEDFQKLVTEREQRRRTPPNAVGGDG